MLGGDDVFALPCLCVPNVGKHSSDAFEQMIVSCVAGHRFVLVPVSSVAVLYGNAIMAAMCWSSLGSCCRVCCVRDALEHSETLESARLMLEDFRI